LANRPERPFTPTTTLLLARMLVPAPMRPGWPAAPGMARSALPHEQLTETDPRPDGR